MHSEHAVGRPSNASLSPGAARHVRCGLDTEPLYRAAVETVPDAVLVAGEDGRLVAVTAAAARLLGYGRDELLGTAYTGLATSNCPTGPIGLGRELEARGETWSAWRLRRRDGSAIAVTVLARRVDVGSRTLDQFVLYARSPGS